MQRNIRVVPLSSFVLLQVFQHTQQPYNLMHVLEVNTLCQLETTSNFMVMIFVLPGILHNCKDSFNRAIFKKL